MIKASNQLKTKLKLSEATKFKKTRQRQNFCVKLLISTLKQNSKEKKNQFWNRLKQCIIGLIDKCKHGTPTTKIKNI